jgi:major membrane immunogen (membrane-anchored lipoprotein)
MMPNDRMPAISLGLIVRVGAVYDASYHWRNEAGELRAAVGFDAGGHSNAHIQGPPAALRELAAALVDAADRAESADDPANGAGLVVEGVAG